MCVVRHFYNTFQAAEVHAGTIIAYDIIISLATMSINFVTLG